MNLIISSTHLTLSETEREYATKKLDKLKKFSPAPNKLHLTLSHQRHAYHAEITCHHDACDLHADAMASELHAAIELVVERMLTLLKKTKVRHAPQLAHANLRAQNKELPVPQAQEAGTVSTSDSKEASS